MGKIFSFDEIVSGQVPQLEAFGAVKALIVQELSSAEEIVGAVLCGSCVTGGWSHRSDIDCVVMYRYEGRYEFMERLRRIRSEAAPLHVPIDFIPIDSDVAQGPVHHLGTSFAQHVRYATSLGGVIKQDPLVCLEPTMDMVSSDTRQYVQYKLLEFERRLSRSARRDGGRYADLQQILDVPVHAARKLLRVRNLLPDDDRRFNVADVFGTHAAERQARILHTLVQADERYTACLLSQLQTPNQDAYDVALCEIEAHAWSAYEFLRQCALELAARR